MNYKNIVIPLNLFHSGNNEIHKFLENLIIKKGSIYGYRTFHFFFEKGRLEIRIDSPHIVSYEEWIKDYFKEKGIEESKLKDIVIEDYKPEIDRFGEGWDIVEKLFENCARAAIYIRNHGDKTNIGELFRESKIIHCFLNQLGYDSLAEASFHNFVAQQMMIKHIRETEIPIYPVYKDIGTGNVAGNVKIEERKQGPEFG